MGDEFEAWRREREERRTVSREGVTQAAEEPSRPAEPEQPAPKGTRKVWRYVLKGVIVFALLRRVFMNAIASAESPSAYGAPAAADYAESVLILIILVLFFTKRKKLSGVLLGVYASLLLIGSLIGFGIDANGKVWMMLTAVIVLMANKLMKHFDAKPEPMEISREDIERLKQNPVRRF